MVMDVKDRMIHIIELSLFNLKELGHLDQKQVLSVLNKLRQCQVDNRKKYDYFTYKLVVKSI